MFDNKSLKWNYKLHFTLTVLFMLLVLLLCYVAYKNPQMAALEKEINTPETVVIPLSKEKFRRMLQTKQD